MHPVTALASMPAAAWTAGVESRMACPLCGGAIHPIAGRCKHCKEDLSAMRSGRPAAAAPLPALNTLNTPAYGAPAQVASTFAPPNNGHTNGHIVASSPLPIMIQQARAECAAQPIPLQRPTGRAFAAARTY